jgi:hypothetical protein
MGEIERRSVLDSGSIIISFSWIVIMSMVAGFL